MLTSTIKQQANSLLDEWQNWKIMTSRPVIIEQLSQGQHNHSFLLATAVNQAPQWVLRINKPGLDRNHEDYVLSLLADTTIAPTTLYTTEHYSLYPYFKGNTLAEHLSQQRSKTPSDKVVNSLIQTIHRYQKLPHNLPLFNYRAILDAYRVALEEKKLFNKTLQKNYRDAYTGAIHLEKYINTRCICHHDLNPFNILITSTGAIRIIDWEFGGAGFAAIDFAGLACELNLPDETIIKMAEIDKQSYHHAKQLYRGLCALWNTQNLPV